MITLHAEVNAGADMLETHDAIDNIEEELKEHLNCHATIHMDPVAVNDEQVNKLKEIAEKTVKEIDGKITIHDFRIVAGPTHTNLIFDAVLPYGFRMTNSQFKELANKKSNECDSTLFAVIDIDQAYIK